MCVCERQTDRQTDRDKLCVCVCVCACVCVFVLGCVGVVVRDRDRDRETEIETERDRESYLANTPPESLVVSVCESLQPGEKQSAGVNNRVDRAGDLR